MRIIKRYSNRRLYDPILKKVINLNHIIEYIQRGEEIKIIEYKTGQDITPQILAQTFLKLTTENKSYEFQIFFLSSLIKEISSNLSNLLIRFLKGGIGTELLTSQKIFKIVQDFIDKGNLNIYEKENYIHEIQRKILNNKEELIQKIQKISENQQIPLIQLPEKPEKN